METRRHRRRSALNQTSTGLLLFLLAGLLPATATEPSRVQLPLPAAVGSAHPDLATARDGHVYVSWTEPTADHQTRLRIAHFDRETEAWGDPVTIASGSDSLPHEADTPTIAAGLRGRVAAAWSVPLPDGGHHALVSTSENHGQDWSAPTPVTSESTTVERVELAPLLNGTWLAVWLDGRARASSGNTQLRSRLIGSADPDTLIDERVSDASPIDTLVMPNGVVLTAYRDRDDDDVQDIAYQNYRRGVWTTAPPPAPDGWKIHASPTNGPNLSRRGGNITAAWFTGARDTPQVLTATSSNLARSWDLVVRVDDPAAPARGDVSSLVLRDGSRWLGWAEQSGAYALRALQSDGSLGPIFRLPGVAPTTASPRLQVLDNRSDQPARFLFVSTHHNRVVTHLITLPAGSELAADDCGCGPGQPADRGHAVTGEIVSLLPDRGALLVDHEDIPGVMPAMTMAFKVDHRVLRLVQPGQRISARMEQRSDGQWWLFGIRLLDSTP